MFSIKTTPLSALLLLAALAGCRAVPMGMEEVGDMLQSSEPLRGEVIWDFAAMSGDEVVVGLTDAAGVLEETSVIPVPGVKHVDFSLSVSERDRTKCASRGSCRYSAELRSGDRVKARGFIYYTTSLHPLIELGSSDMAPEAMAAGAPNGGALPSQSGAAPSVQRQVLPKPVYR